MTKLMRPAAALLTVSVLVVRPVFAQPTWTLVENLRLGTAADGPNSFTNVGPIAVAKNGDIFVVDKKPVQIKKFSSDGKFLRNIGRTGAGPGEYNGVQALTINAQGNLFVVAPADGRTIAFSPDGALVRQTITKFRITGGDWDGQFLADGGLLIPINRPSNSASTTDERAKLLVHVKSDGAHADTLPYPSCTTARGSGDPYLRFESADGHYTQFRVPFLSTPRTAFGSDGTAWCAPGDTYAVYHFRVGRGETLHVARQNVAPDPLTAAQKAELDASVKRAVNGSAATLPKTQPMISAIRVDDANRLWVRRSSTPENSPSFDVFDAQGRVLATVKSNLKWVGTPYVFGDAAYGLVRGEDDIPLLVRARIQR